MADAPDVDALWTPLCAVLPRLDGNPARCTAFTAWRAWLVDRSDSLSVEATAFEAPEDLLWYAKVVRFVRGSAAAYPLFELAVERDPSSFWAQFELANASSSLPDRKAGMAKAFEHASAAVVLDPRSGWAFTNRGVYSIELAVQYLTEAEAAVPELAARLRDEVERLRAISIKSYEKAIDLNPFIAVAHCNLANGITDPNRKLSLYRQALAIEPCAHGTIVSLRDFLRKTRGFDDLVEALEGAMACDPSSTTIRYWLVEARYDQGRARKEAMAEGWRDSFGRASEEITDLRRLAPENADVIVLAILLQLERGQPEEGIRQLNALLAQLELHDDPLGMRASLNYHRTRLTSTLLDLPSAAATLARVEEVSNDGGR